VINLPPPKPHNPETFARQRRAAVWQIYLPLVVAVAALLAVMALTLFAASMPTRSVWADVSLMYLIVFAVIGGLLIFALLAAFVFGLWFALRELPGYFKIAQDFMALVASRAAEVSQRVAGFFITPRASVAAAQKALDSARTIITTRRKS
jgi:hypothetical protein